MVVFQLSWICLTLVQNSGWSSEIYPTFFNIEKHIIGFKKKNQKKKKKKKKNLYNFFDKNSDF